MTLQELESSASRGLKKDEEAEGPDRDELMAVVEIRSKIEELSKEIQQYGRWDKEVIAKKTAAIIFFSARLAGMYGVNLEEAVRLKVDEIRKETAAAPDKPAGAIGKNNEKTVQRPKREPVLLPKVSKFKGQPRR